MKQAFSIKFLFTILVACILSSEKEALAFDINQINPTFSTAASTGIPPIVYRIPPDSTGIGSFKLISLALETGNARVTEVILPDTTAVQISISTKSGYQFSTFLRKEETVKNEVFEATDSLIAVSDIEGNFNAFAQILIQSGVVDSSLNWSFGKNRLVLPGDFFDRGDEVFEVLWLIYKLEQEAAAAGGKVHFILGNHEIMNLMRDHRYVHPKYPVFAEAINVSYENWLAPGSVLGDWLRTKNCIEKIGETIFVHAGLSPALAAKKWSLKKINKLNRQAMNSDPNDLSRSCEFIVGEDGPLWYRGMSTQKLSRRKVNRILRKFEAEQVVVGHTIVNPEHISSLYRGKVINIDLHHNVNYGKGKVRALLIMQNDFFEIDHRGEKRKIT